MAEEFVEEEEVSCRVVSITKMTSDEQLAQFMHRFNLDWDTVECMPAFKEHCREFIKPPVKKE